MAATGWQVPTSYDRLEDGATHRSADPAYGIRRLNGFIKEVLFTNAIREVHSRPIRIVDLACGRGGDIGRFSRAVGGSFEYVGVDVSANQIAAARAREKAGYWPPGVSTKWTVADAFDPKAVAEVASMANPSFNVVSIQMALHYAAESKERMSNALGNAAALCAPGGVLIITTTDWKHMIDYATLGSDAATEGDVCTVKILDWADKGEFGVKVQFSLKGRVDDPEYLIGGPSFPSFSAMMRDRGFVQHTWMNMAEYLDVEIKKPEVYSRWMEYSKGEPCKKSDWDVVSLYACGVFTKLE